MFMGFWIFNKQANQKQEKNKRSASLKDKKILKPSQDRA
jgi:hypothetical protein